MPGLFESLLHQRFVQEIRGCWCLHSPDRLTAIPETDSLRLSLPEGAANFKRETENKIIIRGFRRSV